MESDDEFSLHGNPLSSPDLRRPSPSFAQIQDEPSRSLSQRRASFDHEYTSCGMETNSGKVPQPLPIATNHARHARARDSLSQIQSKVLPIPTKSTSNIPHNCLPSAPASPPTPAPSPTPFERNPSWTSAGENEDTLLRDARSHFLVLSPPERERYLAELLNMCDSHLLSFVHQFVAPRLKKDPFTHLPNELSLRVCGCVWLPSTPKLISCFL